ncbi:MAG: anthranilate phosphoribosyltransferase [Nitriliruptoraceae bacterium]|nr:anthranilate phosphoribosyltransferase [Nitriliruptoraceae bacterium]
MSEQEIRWPAILSAVLRGEDLEESLAHEVMGTLMRGEAESAQVAGLLVALRAKGEAASEIAGFVRAMLDAAAPLELDPALVARLVDTCGTGGDGANTFNISTVAALVVAAAGVPVAKHGNRAASSACGSADLLEGLGVHIELPPEAVGRVLAELQITFLFARSFHPAMRFVAPVRAQLGIRTAFNVLGPLSNPAGAPHQVVGVSDPALTRPMAEALARLGKRRALVFRGHDGLDELTTTAPSDVLEVRDGAVTARVLDPADLGIARASLDDLRGGGVEENVAIAQRILDGEPGPRADIVALNAAAALFTAGAVDDLADGVARARAVLDDGTAAALKDRWVARTTELAGRG